MINMKAVKGNIHNLFQEVYQDLPGGTEESCGNSWDSGSQASIRTQDVLNTK